MRGTLGRIVGALLIAGMVALPAGVVGSAVAPQPEPPAAEPAPQAPQAPLQERPFEAQVAPDIVQGFLDTWRGRFQDQDWMQGYMDSPEVVRDEFWAMSDPDRRGLARALVHEMMADPKFRAELQPESDPGTWEAREQFAVEMFYGTLFDKDHLQQIMQPPEAQAAPPTEESGESAESFDPITGELLPDVETLVERIDANREPPPQPEAPLLAAEPLQVARDAAEGRLEAPESVVREHPDVFREPPQAKVEVPSFPMEEVPEARPVQPEFLPALDFPFPDAEAGVAVSPQLVALPGAEELGLPAQVAVSKASLPLDASLQLAPVPTPEEFFAAHDAPVGSPDATVALPDVDAPELVVAADVPELPVAAETAVPAPEIPVAIEAPASVEVVAVPDPSFDPPTTPAAIQAFAKALTYTACGQVPGGPVRCLGSGLPGPGATLQPGVPFGVPIALDLDGVPTTGIAGQDVIVEVVPTIVPRAPSGVPAAPKPSVPAVPKPPALPAPPAPNPASITQFVNALVQAAKDAAAGAQGTAQGAVKNATKDTLPVGIGVTLSVRVLPNPVPKVPPSVPTVPSLTAPRMLPAKVWIVYGIADADATVKKLLRLGLDGTTSTLPELTTLQLKVKDLVALVQGRVLATANLTFEKAGPDVALFAGFDDVNAQGQPVNPTTITLHMTPVPNIGAELDAMVDGSRFTGIVKTSVSSKVTVTYNAQRTTAGQSTTAQVILDRLPTTVQVEFERLSDGARLRYDASSTINTVTVGFTRTEPGTSIAGTLVITSLPDVIEVFLRPGEKQGSVLYLASSGIPLVTGTFSLTQGGVTTTGSASVANIPARILIDWDLLSNPSRVTYDASSSLGPVSLSFNSGPGRPAFAATIASLPPWMQVKFSMPNFIEFDARASASAPQGSAALGSVVVSFATDGSLMCAGIWAIFCPSEDHVLVSQGTATSAHLKYTGLQYAMVSIGTFWGVNYALMEVRNSAPRFFKYSVNMPGALISGHIDSIPQRVQLSIFGTSFTYDAFGQRIEQIVLNFDNKESPPLTANIDIRGIPSRINVVLNMGAKKIDYKAVGQVDTVDITASIPTSIGTFSVSLGITAIPEEWSASFADGGFAYDSAVGIGSIDLFASNIPPKGGFILFFPCGTVSIFPLVVVPNHFCATLDLPNQQFKVELALVKVKHVEYRKSGDNAVMDLSVGGGQRFVGSLRADLTTSQRAVMSFDISNLPTSIHLQTGTFTRYTASNNFDLSIDATIGHPSAFNAIPDPPNYALGISVRDGASWGATALKAKVRLTGVPTDVTFGRVSSWLGDYVLFDAKNWKPKSTTFVADADLDNIVSDRIYGKVTILNLVPFVGASQDIRAEYHTLKVGKLNFVQVNYDTKTSIGPVYAQAILETNNVNAQARLDVSNIPTSIDFTATLNDPTSVISWRASSPISSIFVGVDVEAAAVGVFDGAITLTDIPASWDLTIGRNARGPEITYTASASTLDLSLSFGAALFSGELKARVLAGFTNLGANTRAREVPGATVTKNVLNRDTSDPCDEKTITETESEGFEVTSTPATTFVFVEVWARVIAATGDDGIKCWSFVGDWHLHWYWGLNLDVTINHLRVEVNKLTSLRVKPGFPLKISGTYDRFFFGWANLDLRLLVSAGARLHWHVNYSFWDICFCWTATFLPIDVNIFLHITNVWFHTANNHLGLWFSIPISISSPCILGGKVTMSMGSINFNLRPHPHSTTKNGFTTYGSGSTLGGDSGNAKWYVLPDLDVAGSPLMGGILWPLILLILADSGDRGFSLGWTTDLGISASWC